MERSGQELYSRRTSDLHIIISWSGDRGADRWMVKVSGAHWEGREGWGSTVPPSLLGQQ